MRDGSTYRGARRNAWRADRKIWRLGTFHDQRGGINRKRNWWNAGSVMPGQVIHESLARSAWSPF